MNIEELIKEHWPYAAYPGVVIKEQGLINPESIKELSALITQATNKAVIAELEKMLEPIECYRPWCTQVHTLLRKSYVKDRIAELKATKER